MALLPPFYLDTVVAIGIGDDPVSRQWIGTGFLYGNLDAKKPPRDGHTSYHVWLITNKHVLRGLRKVYVKFNSAVDPDSVDYEVPLISRNGKSHWVGHPTDSIDVAAIAAPVKILREHKRQFSYFRSDTHVSTRQMLTDNQVTEGDRVFVLGFPMGLVDAARQYVICRGGVLARIRDFISGSVSDFMVDATVFPGNSGGPVVLCPSALAITGTKTVQRADLIGVVKSYVPYRDMAVSSQTRQPRIIFEENSGLASVESTDSIIETVSLAERRLKSRIDRMKRRGQQLTPSTSVPPTVVIQAAPDTAPNLPEGRV